MPAESTDAERQPTGKYARSRRATLSRRAGFTLTELALTAAILLVLVAVLHPALSHARQRVRDISCESILGQFGVGLAMYAVDNEGWIPGVNTSGVATRAASVFLLNQSDLPVQSCDFMTPLAPYIGSGELPENRAARWHYLWTEYRCPSQKRMNDAVYSVPPMLDLDDFLQYEWPACSYLMPVYFQWWGSLFDEEVVGWLEGGRPIYAETVPDMASITNLSYHSHLIDVGPADRKIFVADGTRVVLEDGQLDFDIDPTPAWFGAFSALGGWAPFANAFGVATGTENWDGDTITRGSLAGGRNLPISYRHGPGTPLTPADALSSTSYPRDAQSNKGGINAVFFDGHVQRMNDRQSRAIDMWYPTGSVVSFLGDGVGMTTVPVGYEIP